MSNAYVVEKFETMELNISRTMDDIKINLKMKNK